ARGGAAHVVAESSPGGAVGATSQPPLLVERAEVTKRVLGGVPGVEPATVGEQDLAAGGGEPPLVVRQAGGPAGLPGRAGAGRGRGGSERGQSVTSCAVPGPGSPATQARAWLSGVKARDRTGAAW